MKTFKHVDKRRYSEQVVQSITAKILSKKMAVGDKLPGEQELIAQFNVSRTVVREAIRVLEESGLVEIVKGRKGGVFVTRVFYKPVSTSLKSLLDHGEVTMQDLFDARLLIEPYIAARAAAKATAEDLESLRGVIDEASSHESEATLLKRDNVNFHLLLAKAARNPVLSILMESVIRLQEELTQAFFRLPSGREHLNIHKELLSLLEKRRSDEASALITEDILRMRDRPRCLRP